jgi:histidine triad (HIT) family protein
MTEKNCIFCKIVKEEIPSVKIWEDENYFAFLDINPIQPGHTLVLPKKHSDDLFELDDRDYLELMLKSKEVAEMLRRKLKPKRIGVIVEGFAVPHVHVHLVPINQGGELDVKRTKKATTEELNKIAEKIKK